MTGPAIHPDSSTGLPSRVLSPDEFQQAKTLTPQGVRQAKFPVIPPIYAPRDATATARDNVNPKAKPLTGLARILTQYVAAPIMDHPVSSVLLGGAALLPVVGLAMGYLFTGMMGKDVLEYSAQKAAEMSLSPEDKKRAEADPERISGEQATVDAVFMTAAPLIHAGLKKIRAAKPNVPLNEALPEVAASEPSTQDLSKLTKETVTAASIRLPGGREIDGHSHMEAMDGYLKEELGLTGNKGSERYKKSMEIFDDPSTVDGFRTSTGRFVTREEAAKIAEKAGQFDEEASPDPRDENELTAEDLGSFPNLGKPSVQIEPTNEGLVHGDNKIIKIISRDATGKPKGLLVLSKTGDKTADVFTVFVDPKSRRKGIATAMYDAAEKSGLTLRSGQSGFSPEGKAFVEARTGKAAPVSDLQKLGDETSAQMQNTKGVIRQHVDRVKDALRTMFAPDNRSPEALKAGGILRAATGELAAEYEQAAFKLDEFRRAIEPMHDIDKLGFIDNIEGGKSQASPEFQAAADEMRGLLDRARDAVQNLGTGKLQSFIENYFPHVWKDPERAADVFKYGGGKRPMEGSKAFLKHRTLPTTVDGIAMGLEPISTNPVDLVLLKVREMQRYVMAHTALTELKGAGLVEYVRAGDMPPDGYKPIDDRIATVFGPREGAVTLPKGAVKGIWRDERSRWINDPHATAMKPSDVTVHGQRIMGSHWAPEAVAKVVNNYLSPGLKGNMFYDAYRGIGNTLNQAQLGLSAFHLAFTSLDASVSRMALGIEYLGKGNLVQGLGEVMSSPTAPITNIMKGLKVRRAYLTPGSGTLDEQAMANAVKEAGGRVRMDSFYKNSAPEKLGEALRIYGKAFDPSSWHWSPTEMEPGKALRLVLPAILETTAKPVMEHIVPLQKLGVFSDLAKKALADLPEDASLADRRLALSEAWNSVDNRMGQLVYDNLFWNKSLKDMSMVAVRSAGWNIGTVREIGGGLMDLSTGQLTHKGAYVIALPIMVGLYGATYQFLRTGEGPQELKDYFFPKNGETDPDGNPQRMQIASYLKDVYGFTHDPVGTVEHKANPMAASIIQMLQNQDYYGDEIRNRQDPVVKQLQQMAEYIGKQVEPLSLRNIEESKARGDQSLGTAISNEVGITPAPRAVVRSEAQNQMAEDLSTRHMTGSTPEDAEARKSRQALLAALRGNKDGSNSDAITDAVTDAIEKHQLTKSSIVRLLKAAGSTPAAEQFKRLTLAQAIDVFKKSTPEEKQKFGQALYDKISRATDRGDPMPPVLTP